MPNICRNESNNAGGLTQGHWTIFTPSTFFKVSFSSVPGHSHIHEQTLFILNIYPILCPIYTLDTPTPGGSFHKPYLITSHLPSSPVGLVHWGCRTIVVGIGNRIFIDYIQTPLPFSPRAGTKPIPTLLFFSLYNPRSPNHVPSHQQIHSTSCTESPIHFQVFVLSRMGNQMPKPKTK